MKTLLIGNIGYITKTFLNEAFPNHQLFLLGDTNLKSSQQMGITVFTNDISLEESIFESYEFDQMIYFSDSLTYQNDRIGELEQLQRILGYAKEQEHIKVLYLTALEAKGSNQIIVKTAQDLCMNWKTSHSSSSLKILQSPYLYSSIYPRDYMSQLFKAAESGSLLFTEKQDELTNFINMDDLSDLLFRLFDSWNNDRETLQIVNPFKVTFKELAEQLQKVTSCPSVQFSSANASQSSQTQTNESQPDKTLRKRYGWFMHYSIIDDLTDLYTLYLEQHRFAKYTSRLDDLISILRSHQRIQKIAEIMALFLVSEFLHLYTNAHFQFRLIDIRLLFVVLVSTVFGTYYGIASAFLSAAALLINNIISGRDWRIILYNTEQWIPFIMYIFIAAVCGFVQMKNQDDSKSLKKENQLLKEQNVFIQGVHSSIVQDKQKLKRQLIGSRDGFAKFFDVFKKLDRSSGVSILEESVKILQEWLDTKAILVYDLKDERVLELLQTEKTASTLLSQTALQPQSFPEILKTVEKGEVWSNRQILKDHPAYVLGVRDGGVLRFLIWVQEVSYNQMGLHQINRLQMIGEMTESALSKAYYQQYYVDQLGKVPSAENEFAIKDRKIE